MSTKKEQAPSAPPEAVTTATTPGRDSAPVAQGAAAGGTTPAAPTPGRDSASSARKGPVRLRRGKEVVTAVKPTTITRLKSAGFKVVEDDD